MIGKANEGIVVLVVVVAVVAVVFVVPFELFDGKLEVAVLLVLG